MLYADYGEGHMGFKTLKVVKPYVSNKSVDGRPECEEGNNGGTILEKVPLPINRMIG